jgi:hypothetical protein
MAMEHLSRFMFKTTITDETLAEIKQYLNEIAFRDAPADRTIVEATDTAWIARLQPLTNDLLCGVSLLTITSE